MNRYSILVVDDDEQVCRILSDLFTQKQYVTRVAGNGRAALELISESAPDLVVSDIQMPFMDGFELLSVLKKDYPGIKHIMMTSYDIDQYIKLIRKHNVGNILAKGCDFNLVEVASYVRSILTGDIFGLERYFNGVELRKIEARSYAEAKEAYRTITESFPDKKNFFLELAIDELISNAIFHGILQLSNLSREHWNEMMHTALQCPVKVNWCSDHEKIGISVEDPSGNLKKTDVLKWLDYHRRSGDANEHGRGFFLVRRLIDRLIINIEPNRRTECIIIQHFRRAKNDYHKPLLIHEV